MVLPFSYQCDKSVDVYRHTKAFVEANDYGEKISELALAYHSISSLIPQTTDSLWSGHYFPWVESWEEYQVSLNLCYFGFYKQAMISLRGALELGFLSVYWNLNDDGHKVVKDWFRSQKDTPKLQDIWNKLYRHRNFQTFQSQLDIHNRIMKLGYLHNYVHSKGYKYSNAFGIFKSNFQTFEEKAFKKWYASFEEVTKVLCLVHLIKYPLGVVKIDYHSKFGIDIPSFGGVEDFEVDSFANLFTPDEFRILTEIALQDENVTGIINWVSSLPDITGEEVEQQIINFDKMMIENHGLENWLKQEQLMPDEARKNEKYQKRLAFLINWAKENGFETSKREKLQ